MTTHLRLEMARAFSDTLERYSVILQNSSINLITQTWFYLKHAQNGDDEKPHFSKIKNH
jgi:hypothetical protein